MHENHTYQLAFQLMHTCTDTCSHAHARKSKKWAKSASMSKTNLLSAQKKLNGAALRVTEGWASYSGRYEEVFVGCSAEETSPIATETYAPMASNSHACLCASASTCPHVPECIPVLHIRGVQGWNRMPSISHRSITAAHREGWTR